ncbi:PhoH family protein, partial [Paenarthrobacter sp. RAF9]
MSESLNGRLRTGNGNLPPTEFPHTLPGTRTEIVTFDNSDQMVHSLGSHDEALRYIEDQFEGVSFHVRGNELSMTGPSTDISRVMRLLEEVRGLVSKGTLVTPDVLQQLVSLLRTQSVQNPADVLTHNILSSRGKTIRPKT